MKLNMSEFARANPNVGVFLGRGWQGGWHGYQGAADKAVAAGTGGQGSWMRVGGEKLGKPVMRWVPVRRGEFQTRELANAYHRRVDEIRKRLARVRADRQLKEFQLTGLRSAFAAVCSGVVWQNPKCWWNR